MKTQLQRAIRDARSATKAKAAIGPMLRKWRKSRKVKQFVLADLLGVTPAFLCDVEKGKRALGDNNLAVLERVLTSENGLVGQPIKES